MRYKLLVFIILLSQLSQAQRKTTWIIEADAGNKIVIGNSFTLIRSDSIQILTDTSIEKLSVGSISKMSSDLPGKSGLIPGIIGGLAGGIIATAKFTENNKDNNDLQPEDKAFATVVMSQLGLLVGFSIGFFPFNRWHRHHTYYFDGLTPAQKVLKLRGMLKM